MGKIKQFESLSTSFVNLAALIRHLRNQTFEGSIQVALEHYQAEVILRGRGPETVSEIDPATGRASQTEGAMERLLVHAREPGGTITVYESNTASTHDDENKSGDELPEGLNQTAPTSAFDFQPNAVSAPAENEIDWNDLLDAGGALVGGVERAVQSLGQEFESNFRAARIELGDDYPFLDPTGNGLTYTNKIITLNAQPSGNAFVTGLSECLRRVINKLAMGKERKRFRETVAVEIAVAARMQPTGLGEFKAQLDHIAGTRVL
jgi:hypothetical protein